MISINSENLPASIREAILAMPESELCDLIYTSFKKHIKTSEPSAIIGKKYELHIEEILMNRFQVINSSQIPHSGDFIITNREYPTHKIMLEAKKYSRVVPATEIQKFYSDLDRNTEIHSAIFMSSGSISGIKSSVEVTVYMCGLRRIPVIFLSGMNSEIASDILLGSVDMLFECMRAEKNNQSVEALLEQTYEIWHELSHIHSACNELSRARTLTLQAKQNLMKQLDTVGDSLWHIESTFNRSLEQIRQILISLNPESNPCGDVYSISNVVDTIAMLLSGKLICGDQNIKTTVTQIIANILHKYQECYAQKFIKIHTDGKNINILQESGSGFMRVSQYRSKLVLSLKNISSGPIKIPKCADYKSGWVMFTIDTLNLRNVCDVIIHNFISDFYTSS